eukprot:gene5173-5691_t
MSSKHHSKKQQHQQQGSNNKKKKGGSGGSGSSGGPEISKNKQKKLKQIQLAIETQNKLFHGYFIRQYGDIRWEKLSASLKKKAQYVAMINRRADWGFTQRLLGIDSQRTLPYLPELFGHRIYGHNTKLAVVGITGNSNNSSEGEEVADHDGVSSKSPLPVVSTGEEEAAGGGGGGGVVDEEVVNEDDDDNNDSDIEVSPPSSAHVEKKDSDSTAAAVEAEAEGEGEVDFSEVFWPAPGSNLDNQGLAVYYPLDAASLLPVLLLDVQPHHRVLDLCAAPGGKSLFILQHLNEQVGGHLISNDISYERKKRLERMMRQYLPVENSISLIDVIHGDATTKRFIEEEVGENRRFDRILVDAPCASERHLIMKSPFYQQYYAPSSSPAGSDVNANGSSGGGGGGGLPSVLTASLIAAMAKDDFMSWATGRSRANAERQLALLKTAFTLCAYDGMIVYSTCSINDMENDQVVEKTVKKMNRHGVKYNARLEVIPIDASKMPYGEKTKYGWHILPDVSEGWGPIYLSVLKKVRLAEGGEEQQQEGVDSDDDL